MKFKLWKKGQIIEGPCVITYKIDGVQAIFDGEVWVSRANKPLYNLPIKGIQAGIYEYYRDNWETSVSDVRTYNLGLLDKANLYALAGNVIDSRLVKAYGIDLTSLEVENLLNEVIDQGYEGLVIYAEGVRYKVKPTVTFDVEVQGVQEGKGKFEGMVGALLTEKGKVGTGLSLEDRRRRDWVGKLIEVECMSLTPNGKFRHPRYIRERWDK